MNNTDAPWTNLKVRQAIAQAIDRKNIVDNFYPPGSTVADYFTPCSIPDACKGDKSWDYDPTAAKTLFQQGMQELGLDPATFTTKLSFRAAVRGYLPDPPTIAQESPTSSRRTWGSRSRSTSRTRGLSSTTTAGRQA